MFLKSTFKKLLLASILLLIFAPLASKISAQTTTWLEEFDSPNPAIWSSYKNDGSISYKNSLLLTQSSANSHPYLHTNDNPFNQVDNFSVEIKFSYSSIGPWGTGITIGNDIFPNNTTQSFAIQNDAKIAQFKIWQDSTSFRIKYQENETNSFSDAITVISKSPDTFDHLLKISKLSNKYYLYLDEIQIYESSETIRLPTSITIGNALSVGGGIKIWSSINVDYIKITENETQKIPIVLIPGLGASWHTEAILTGSQEPQGEWKMTPFVNIYDNLTNSLNNSEYELGNNLFVFNYDWRQTVADIANDLDLFIENNIGDQEVNLIGHSLGGLVARTWWQGNHDNKVNKIITLGSPHQGALQAYEALAGGKISNSFSWGSAALNILLRLRNPIYKTNAQILQTEAPVLNDLLPVFNFLKKRRRAVPYQNLSFKNNWLDQANQNIPDLDKIEYLSGNTGVNVNEWLYVKSPSLTQKLLGLWPDGVPYRYLKSNGDTTVLLKSSFVGKDPLVYALNHRQLVHDADTIEKILDILEISHNQIAQESVFSFNDTLIFLIASPATLQVTSPNGNAYPANYQGFVVIPNPEPGNYQATLLGTNNGEYHLLTGQLFNDSFWNIYQGLVTPGEQLSYEFNINPNSPNSNPLINSEKHQLEVALREIKNLNDKYPSEKLNQAKEKVEEAISETENNNLSTAVNKIKEGINSLFEFRKDNPQLGTLKESEKPIKLLTNVLGSLLEKEDKIASKEAKKEYLKAKKQYSLTFRKIRLQQRRNRVNDLSLISNLSAQEYLNKAKTFLKEKNYPNLSALSYSAHQFSKEIF